MTSRMAHTFGVAKIKQKGVDNFVCLVVKGSENYFQLFCSINNEQKKKCAFDLIIFEVY